MRATPAAHPAPHGENGGAAPPTHRRIPAPVRRACPGLAAVSCSARADVIRYRLHAGDEPAPSRTHAPRPCGVPLSDLEAALSRTSLKVSRQRDTLLIRHEHYLTRIALAAPEKTGTTDGRIAAIVTVRTELPPEVAHLFAAPGLMSLANSMASLGAVTEDGGRYFVGARLTVHEGDEAWAVTFGLVLLSAAAATDSMLGALRRTLGQEPPASADTSSWTPADFEHVHSHLSRVCVCTTGGAGLTAEFPIRTGGVSAAPGRTQTALWRMRADEPHPDIGPGLFCLLSMPHAFPDSDRLDQVLAELNRLDMQPADHPPHFGAWCRGPHDTNPAYVSFLPDVLHSSAGIALNISLWGMHRAQMAGDRLAALGVSPT